jgi:hypothetical protein
MTRMTSRMRMMMTWIKMRMRSGREGKTRSKDSHDITPRSFRCMCTRTDNEWIMCKKPRRQSTA